MINYSTNPFDIRRKRCAEIGKRKKPLIIVKLPKPSWVQEIFDNSSKMQKEYEERTWKRILYAAFGDK